MRPLAGFLLALWLIGGLGAESAAPVQEALRSRDANFRVLALRVLRLYGADMVAATKALLDDPSPAVRREAAVDVARPARLAPRIGLTYHLPDADPEL